jgi:tetratricopeptide (TPR) repeat protein
MSVHLERARLLLAQSRPADAEREALQALAGQPENPDALALLALSRLDQGKGEAALAAAQEALGFAPDHPYFHYVLGIVLHRLERNDDAHAAAQEAISRDPSDASHFVLLSSIQLARRDWPGALTAAESALALDPEHVNAANLRAMALVRLGRKEEATATVDFALHRAPENAFSHANQGWNCLHRNDPKRAQEHFREALRLEPDLEYARDGMLEALKARNPIYRGMLAYFLWMSRLGAQYQWGIILGCYFGGRLLTSTARQNPEYHVLWWILIGLFYAFVYLTWTAAPMFNLFLRLNRFGRHVLSHDQRVASNWFGAFFLGALGAVTWFFTTETNVAFFTMFCLAVLSVCVAATFTRPVGKRRVLAIATTVLATIAALGMIPVGPDQESPNGLMLFFVYGFLGFQILANTTARR